MAPEDDKGFDVYKGLQKPLVFKSFKGKYIYWGLASVLIGFFVAVILSVLINFTLGLVALVVVAFGGMGFTAMQQKNGLHHKTKSRGVYIMPAQWRRRTHR